jgi:hypothetical protein
MLAIGTLLAFGCTVMELKSRDDKRPFIKYFLIECVKKTDS